MGCYRTGEEIGSWMTLSDGAKKRVVAKARQRRAERQQTLAAPLSD
jgi:predicted Fe-S protein YdhL (DUF1289 family)